jgi:hypothetical protein
VSDSASEPVILGYAQEKRSPVTRVVRLFVAACVMLVCALVGWVLGGRAAPLSWRGSALYRVEPPSGAVNEGAMQTWADAVTAHVKQMRSPAAMDAVIQDLRTHGHTIGDGEEGRRWLARRLDVRHIPNSALVQVAFDSRDPKLTTDVIDAVVVQGISASVDGRKPRLFAPSPPPQPSRSPAGHVLGMIGGAVLGLAAVLLWIRAKRDRALRRF